MFINLTGDDFLIEVLTQIAAFLSLTNLYLKSFTLFVIKFSIVAFQQLTWLNFNE